MNLSINAKLPAKLSGKLLIPLTDKTALPKSIAAEIKKSPLFKKFKAQDKKELVITSGELEITLIGMGKESEKTTESVRRLYATLVEKIEDKAIISVAGLLEVEEFKAAVEGLLLADYSFLQYKKDNKKQKAKNVTLLVEESSAKHLSLSRSVISEAKIISEQVYFCRDLVNEPPNVLHSEEYAKRVKKLYASNKNVKVKILGRKELIKEKMGLFLSVNAGSQYEPRMVQLSYTPAKVNSKTKHIALVGKGLTFDTGGYSLKPSASIMNMKTDMAGSATVLSAFNAAVKLGSKNKITCLLGMTDNAISSRATLPDSIVKSRSGLTVEILNTDAEGRLVLADVLSYACDLKPDQVIDAATLTGACVVALGTEVCGIMGNSKDLTEQLLSAAKATDEYMWELPIIEEFRNDIKSPIADLKNMGSSRWAGTSKAAAFLENFISKNVKWAHLDIAGIADSQKQPYCPKTGASGLIIRSLVKHLVK